jgi:CbiX
VTDLSEPADPEPGRPPLSPGDGEPLPQRGEPLPQRSEPLPQRGGLLPQRNGSASSPSGAPLPQRGGLLPQRNGSAPSPSGEPLPRRGEPLSQPGEPLPQRGEPLPRRAESSPQSESPLPQRNGTAPSADPLPRRGEPLPQRGEPLPQQAEPLPQQAEPLPQRDGSAAPSSEPLPQRGAPLPLPQRGAPLPQRGGPATGAASDLQPGAVLPRRTGRTRPAGRHRSPHRLSVAPEAPALVIAVPGTAEADTAGIAADVAATASASCPGVDVRVGYLEGSADSLEDCLEPSSDSGQPNCVVVPLLLSPNARADAAVSRVTAEAGDQVLVGTHLAPHPLVAEALHARLAEAGLVRRTRSTGLSISTGGRGIIVLSDVGEEAASAAAVAAVLLASRLSVPVMPASLGEPASIADAVTRLDMSGAASPALAPCLIGPEFPPHVLDSLSRALGAPIAATLGNHQAVGQLVAIRYGAALARMSVAAG